MKDVAALKERLWVAKTARPATIYGIFDGARRSEIYDAVARSYREKCCLFAGKLDAEIERAAPHLLLLHARDSLTDYLLLNGWTDAWGILLQSEMSFSQVRRHLRTLLRVRDEAGRFLLFRYYDPRVLTTYLPTCTPAELRLVFGTGITRIFAPAAGKAWLTYSLEEKGLKVEATLTGVSVSPVLEEPGGGRR